LTVFVRKEESDPPFAWHKALVAACPLFEFYVGACGGVGRYGLEVHLLACDVWRDALLALALGKIEFFMRFNQLGDDSKERLARK